MAGPWKRVALTVAAFVASLIVIAPPAAANDLCGQTITMDVKLHHDLSCAGDGLIVGADDITIRLNGHTISGSGTDPDAEGISIVGRADVTIKGPGTVTSFRTGILIEGSNDVRVERVWATGNGFAAPNGPPFPLSRSDGIHVTNSWDVNLRRNVASENQDDGINVHASSGVRVRNNVVDDNGHDGVRLDLADRNAIAGNFVRSHDSIFPIGGVPTPVGCGIELFGSSDNEIGENRLVANTNGIRLRMSGTIGSTGNELEENKVDGTGAALGGRRGIHLTGTSISANVIEENKITNHVNGIQLEGTPAGNTFEENKIRMNTCGVKGPTAGNTFEENKFRDNGADFCA